MSRGVVIKNDRDLKKKCEKKKSFRPVIFKLRYLRERVVEKKSLIGILLLIDNYPGPVTLGNY